MKGTTSVKRLGLSGRARFALHGGNIKTVGELVALDRAALLALPASGQKLVAEIEEALASNGLALGQPLDTGSRGSASEPEWRLERRLEIPPLYGREGQWFDGELDDVLLEQLASKVFGRSVDETRGYFRSDWAGLKAARVSDVAEVPIEVWEVHDASGVIGRLILSMGDAGALFMPADSATAIEGDVMQGYWHGDDAIGERLAASQDALDGSRYRGSSLFSVRFEG
jgi:hypothetical protein